MEDEVQGRVCLRSLAMVGEPSFRLLLRGRKKGNKDEVLVKSLRLKNGFGKQLLSHRSRKPQKWTHRTQITTEVLRFIEMGCTSSSSSAQAFSEDRMNQKIEASQNAALKENKQKIDLLLLGTGDSGKTSMFSNSSFLLPPS